MSRKISFSLLLPLLLFSLFSQFFVTLRGAYPVFAAGAGPIQISVSFRPCVDSWGYTTQNPDGTFYPEDSFILNYTIQITDPELSLTDVKVIYDSGSFSFAPLSWGGLTGSALFTVLPSAAPKTHYITVKAIAEKPEPDPISQPLVSQSSISVAPPTEEKAKVGQTATGSVATVTFSAEGLSDDASGTILLVDSQSYGYSDLPISFSWEVNSTHTFEWRSPVSAGVGKRYVWTSTTGLSTLREGTIRVPSNGGEIKASYKTQYFFAVESNHGSPTGEGWYDAGSWVTSSVSSPVSGGPQVEYVCVGYVGSGSAPASGTDLTVTFQINEPSSITWKWKIVYWDTASVEISVVKYDPHFSTEIVYSVFSGSSQWDKIGVVVKYLGNGPANNLRERAFISEYYLQAEAWRIADWNKLTDMLINFTENYPSTATLVAVFGLTEEAKGTIVKIDGKEYSYKDLPKIFDWGVGSTHSFEWTEKIQVDEYSYFLWSQVGNATKLAGEITVTDQYNFILGIYDFARDVRKFAEDAGVPTDQAIILRSSLPLYFDQDNQYAKLRFDLNPKVVSSLIEENFTGVIYKFGFGTSRFAADPLYVIEGNFTTFVSVPLWPIHVVAWRWGGREWEISARTGIEAIFEYNLEISAEDYVKLYTGRNETDPNVVALILEDLSNVTGKEVIYGMGDVSGNFTFLGVPVNFTLRAGPARMTIDGDMLWLGETREINFVLTNFELQREIPYTIYINLDPDSPLDVEVKDGFDACSITLNIPPELGGAKKVTIYEITSAPAGYSIPDLPLDKLKLREIHTEDLRAITTGIQTFGFYGKYITNLEKRGLTTHPDYSDKILLLIEVENAWGIKFHKIIALHAPTPIGGGDIWTTVALGIAIIIVVAVLMDLFYYLATGKHLEFRVT